MPLSYQLPSLNWKVDGVYGLDEPPCVEGTKLKTPALEDFTGFGVLLRRQD
ncbi:MAG: hypothetical protein JJT75_10000 [Opitutales bacterium]|nr:hypothetical protein [Opitutales bacterium]